MSERDVGRALASLYELIGQWQCDARPVELHMGKTAYSALREACRSVTTFEERETPSTRCETIFGIPVFDDLENPFAWRVDMSDGTFREGVCMPKIEITGMKMVECGYEDDVQRRFWLDYFIGFDGYIPPANMFIAKKGD